MAGSRLDRIGTIFSRTTGLLKAGAVRYQDRPLWYDVYRVFPPKYEPHIDREAENKEVMNMLYKEDKFRAMFFKKFGMNPGGIARKLNDRTFEEPSQPFIKVCLDLLKTRPEWDDTQVFNAAVETHLQKLATLKSQRSYGSPSLRAEAGSGAEGMGFGKYSDLEMDVKDEAEAEASKRHGRRTPTITVKSLRSLFEEAKDEADRKKKLEEGSLNDSKNSNKDEGGSETERKS